MGSSSTRRSLGPLALAALGVVFGDIGTSPLYAYAQCFSYDFRATPQNVLGILSLIIWALIAVVCVKYVTFMLRADYDGEGGILALLARVAGSPEGNGMPVALGAIAMIALFGAAALYGDGIITPAISVISAIEGLGVWTKTAQPFIVPMSVAVLAGLFMLQPRGTGRVGKLFGPVMLLWFLAIGVAGAVAVSRHPAVLAAVSPAYGVAFFIHHGLRGALIFGAVVLCVTGAEALYADLAHFGRAPITAAWYAAVFPALLLNYLGQGAHTLVAPSSVDSAFYALYPSGLVVPMVLLSTAATVIASQSLISGAFSLTHQATQLGLAPRFWTVHTSKRRIGQIYVPAVNVFLAIGCIALVVTFRSSAALAGAYGLAVSVTMLATTITYAALTHRRFRWPLASTIAIVSLFLLWDVPFFVGNLSKVPAGGWFPLVVATALFTLFTTWNRGRTRLMTFLQAQSIPVEDFLKSAGTHASVEGTAVFFTSDPRGIPAALHNWWITEHLALNAVVLLTMANVGRPYVAESDRVEVESLSPHLVRVHARYGFMQHERIDEVMRRLKESRPDLDLATVTYYLPAPSIDPKHCGHRLPAWQRLLYVWMLRNAHSRIDALGLPADRVMQFGVNVPM